MAYTDRELLKQQQAGALGSSSSGGTVVSDAVAAVAAAHTHSRDFTKVGTENAATNVAETLMFVVNRKSKPTIKFLTGTNVATDNTDYLVIKVAKKTAGAASVPVATWNTHGGAQGAITADIPATLVNVTSSDSIIAANDTLHYTVTKSSATGRLVAIGTFTVDLESI